MKAQSVSEFTGYEKLSGDSKVVELFHDGKAVEQLAEGETGIVVLATTPFYAESGGQVGDTGNLVVNGVAVPVKDTQYLGKAIGHHVKAEAALKIGDIVAVQVDLERREAIKRNHSATHLLHAALRNVLGEHVTQKGSLVDEQRLRFDFSHFQAVTAQELTIIERQVNEEIRQNHALQTRLMAIDEAREAGAMALFGEKYDDQVRVVSMGDYSLELCGGTHVKQTGDIGSFRIVMESGIAAGVRRVEACTGAGAVEFTLAQQAQLRRAAEALKTDPQHLLERLQVALERSKGLDKKVTELQQQLAAQAGSSILDDAEDIAGVKVVVAKLDNTDAKALRGIVDDLKNQIGSGIVLLGVSSEDKVSLIAGVTKDLVQQVKAGDLVNVAATVVGGKGGGRPDMAQAGGSQPEKLTEALAAGTSWLREQLR